MSADAGIATVQTNNRKLVTVLMLGASLAFMWDFSGSIYEFTDEVLSVCNAPMKS